MRSLTYILFVSVFVSVTCRDYFFGKKTPESKLMHRETVFYEAFPLMKRVKFYDYQGPNNLVIKAIDCFDYQKSDASVNITEGGIGFNHFQLRMKSERNYRLEYHIAIYG